MPNTDISIPTFTQQVDQNYFIEPLGGPTNPFNLLDRFPDELYSKSPETHFIKFMYSLLGPAGVGWIKKQYLDAKLKLYAQGFTGFDIEKYYGDPFRFGRILLEQLPEDPAGLLPRDQWDIIKARDESYRNRAVTYFNALRAGGTPHGLELAAQSGLNHAAFIIENYKALFDNHSDEPLGLQHYGQTTATEEFIVVPRRETSATEIQIISFANVAGVSGGWTLTFKGATTKAISWDANNFEVEAALKELGTIGPDGVKVTGGPNPNAFQVQFTGVLSNQDVPTLIPSSAIFDNLGEAVGLSVRTLVGGVPSVDEVVHVSDEINHNMQTAIDFLRPLNSLPSTYDGTSTRTRQIFRSVSASSQYTEAIKYVTGSDEGIWPEPDSLNWIEPGKEKEARRIKGDLQQHYVSYHTPSTIKAYTDEALEDPDYSDLVNILDRYKSEHIGQFDPKAVTDFHFLQNEIGDTFVYAAQNALPSCSQPIEVTSVDDNSGDPLVEGTILTSATDHNAVTSMLPLSNRTWWSSRERTAPGSELLEIDLGSARMVNWISFDITTKPLTISLDYDSLDQEPLRDTSDPTEVLEISTARRWSPVTSWNEVSQGGVSQGSLYLAVIETNPATPPWTNVRLFFRDANQHNIVTRYLRLTFARPEGAPDESTFADPRTQSLIPYSVDVKNLRLGRYSAGITPPWSDAY